MNGKALLVLALAATATNACAKLGQGSSPRSGAVAQGSGPKCNAAAQIARFHKTAKEPLDWLARTAGAITTPLKYLSTAIDGPAAWQNTGCNASGIGRPIRTAQHSTEGLYTVDVVIISGDVSGSPIPPGLHVRLEVLPGRDSHRSVRKRRPQPTDVIGFGGPLVWDKDKRCAHHCDGHMEVHPIETIEYLPIP